MRPPRGVEPGQPELLRHVVLNPEMPRRLQEFWAGKPSGNHHGFIIGMPCAQNCPTSVWLDGKSIRPAVESERYFPKIQIGQRSSEWAVPTISLLAGTGVEKSFDAARRGACATIGRRPTEGRSFLPDLAIMIRERVLQFAQHLHPSWRTRRDPANSGTDTAASFVTVGKSWRNSLRASPPSR